MLLIIELIVCVCVCSMQSLDMPTAVQYLSESDVALQVLGAAYIQHKCYHSNEAKNQVTCLHVDTFGHISLYLLQFLYVINCQFLIWSAWWAIAARHLHMCAFTV